MTQKAFLIRLKKDHDVFLGNFRGEEDRLDEHLADRKKLSAIMDLQASYHKSNGQYSTAFFKAIQVVDKFLSSSPRVTLTMPGPVTRLKFEGQLKEADTNLFWELVATPSLEKAGFHNSVEKQQELAADAVASWSEGNELQEVPRALC